MQQRCVFQEWMFELPMQQQSVLVLACRGPDGVRKFHPAKQIVTYYRAAVLKAARVGRKLSVGEARGGSFMTLSGFDDYNIWGKLKEDYFSTIDELPLHYCLHLAHGAEILGYKHPDELFRGRWSDFYFSCCDDLHMFPETEYHMDRRLSDWDQDHWER